MFKVSDIIKDRETLATFSHYIDGSLYYTIPVGEELYQFPIDITDKADIGTAVFTREFKAITLMRYIRKALDNETFVKTK